MADKQLSFSISIKGLSQEAAALAKVELQLKNLRRERNALMKQATRPGHIASKEERLKLAAYNQEINKQVQLQKQLKQAINPTQSSFMRLGKTILSSLGIFASAAIAVRAVFNAIKGGIEDIRNFEDEFTNVLTLLNEAQKLQYEGALKRGAIDLMSTYGFTIEETNKALFDYISATGDAAGAIDFLNKSAIVAIGGNSTLSAVVDGATNVMGAYGSKAGSTEEILNSFFAAQVKGKTTVEELAVNIGKVASTAATADIPISELMATFASLTKFLGGTEESATALMNVINAVIAPGQQAKGVFADLGIETGITAVKQDGLLNKLLEVAAAYEGNNDVLTEVIPNIRAFRGIAGLTSEAIREIETNVTDLNDTELSSLLVQEAFNEKMDTGARKTKIVSASWKALVIEIGGGESIFKKIGNDIRDSLIDVLQKATNKLKLLKINIQSFFDIFRKEENKRAEDMIKEYTGVNDEIIKDEKITTIELTDEEKRRLAKLEAIRKKAREKEGKSEKEDRDKLNKIIIDASIKTTREINKEGEKSSKENEKLLKTGLDYRQEIIDSELQSVEDQVDREIDLWNEGYDKWKKIEDEKKNMQWQIAEQTTNGLTNLWGQYTTRKYDKQFNALSDQSNLQLSALEKQYDAEITAAGDNAGLKKKIETEYIAKKEKAEAEYQKKKNALMHKEDVANKVRGIFESVINTLLGISKALTSPLTIPLIPYIAAQGAIQTAFIAAEPLPKYIGGGKINKGLSFKTSQKDDTLILANKTETVLTDKHVAMLGGPRVMRSIGVPGYEAGGYIGSVSPVMQSGQQSIEIDYNKLTDNVSKKFEVWLNLNKVNSGLRELEVINKSEKL